MNFCTGFVLISVAVCAAGLNYEANDGDDVTIPFNTAELDRAERVMITRGREVIARYCRCEHCGDCSVLETPGVVLNVEDKTLTLLHVSSRHSGLYEANIITGNNLFKKENATLHVNSREPLLSQTTSKPRDSSELQGLIIGVLIPPVVFISVVLGVRLFCEHTRESAADVEAQMNLRCLQV